MKVFQPPSIYLRFSEVFHVQLEKHIRGIKWE